MNQLEKQNHNNFDTKFDDDVFDIEAKREQWKKEREEMREEENRRYLYKTERYLPIYTIVIFFCFLSLAFVNREIIMEDVLYNLEQSNRFLVYLLQLIWFGAIGDTTRLAIQKEKPLVRFCATMILCAVLSIGAMLFSFTQLPESTANTVFMLGRLFALAGAVCTVYPIKYVWLKKHKNI